jgi:hypothetical protein
MLDAALCPIVGAGTQRPLATSAARRGGAPSGAAIV